MCGLWNRVEHWATYPIREASSLYFRMPNGSEWWCWSGLKIRYCQSCNFKTIENFKKSGTFSVFWELKLLYYCKKSFKNFETGCAGLGKNYRSRPQPATDNGVRDGRSNWLVAPPHLHGQYPMSAFGHSINLCSQCRESTLQPSACAATTVYMRPLRV